MQRKFFDWLFLLKIVLVFLFFLILSLLSPVWMLGWVLTWLGLFLSNRVCPRRLIFRPLSSELRHSCFRLWNACFLFLNFIIWIIFQLYPFIYFLSFDQIIMHLNKFLSYQFKIWPNSSLKFWINSFMLEIDLKSPYSWKRMSLILVIHISNLRFSLILIINLFKFSFFSRNLIFNNLNFRNWSLNLFLH